MSDDDTATVTRNLIVQRLGTPDLTVGSVNEPREREEHGVRFNEKWVYRRGRGEPDDARERHVYWDRYDFVGSFVVDDAGRATREDPRALVTGMDDRLFRRYASRTRD